MTFYTSVFCPKVIAKSTYPGGAAHWYAEKPEAKSFLCKKGKRCYTDGADVGCRSIHPPTLGPADETYRAAVQVALQASCPRTDPPPRLRVTLASFINTAVLDFGSTFSVASGSFLSSRHENTGPVGLFILWHRLVFSIFLAKVVCPELYLYVSVSRLVISENWRFMLEWDSIYLAFGKKPPSFTWGFWFGLRPTWLQSVNWSDGERTFYGFGIDHNGGVWAWFAASQTVLALWTESGLCWQKNSHNPSFYLLKSLNQKALWNTAKKKKRKNCSALFFFFFCPHCPLFLLFSLSFRPSVDSSFVFRQSQSTAKRKV